MYSRSVFSSLVFIHRRAGLRYCGALSTNDRLDAPRGWGLGRPQTNFSKINVEIAYFSVFLRAETVSSAVASRHD